MTELWLTALGAAVMCLAILTGLHALRTRWELAQHKDQIEFLLDLVAKQAVQQNSKANHHGLMR